MAGGITVIRESGDGFGSTGSAATPRAAKVIAGDRMVGESGSIMDAGPISWWKVAEAGDGTETGTETTGIGVAGRTQ